MNKKEIIKKINELYAEKKRQKYPYAAPELLPSEVQSDQIKAVIEVFADILEELVESPTVKG